MKRVKIVHTDGEELKYSRVKNVEYYKHEYVLRMESKDIHLPIHSLKRFTEM